MIISLIILLLIAIMMAAAGKYRRVLSGMPGRGNALKVFYPLSMWIIELLRKKGVNICNDRNAASIRNMDLLGGDDNNMKYTVRKLSQMFAVVTAGCIFSLMYGIASGGSGGVVSLTRPDYGEEPENISIKINGSRSDIELQPVLYTPEAVENNFVLAYEYILDVICGDNSSLGNVTDNLKLITYIDQYDISISWYSDNFELVDTEGKVYNRHFGEGQTENVKLTAVLACQDYSCIYEIDVVITSPVLDGHERIIRNAEALIQKINTENRLESDVALPSLVDGVAMSYSVSDEKYEWLFLFAGFASAIVIFFGRDGELRKKDKERKIQMLIDYPEIVSKLNILMGAGMSVRTAWEKIINDYRSHKGSVRRYAYEEMVITYNEICTGQAEGIAYSGFGKRCNIHEYLKLGAMLEQNVKSGTKGLAAMLEDEAMLAFELRKNMAVRMGEEAGTKLLFPMIMMLGVVMVIVMVPALMSLGV